MSGACTARNDARPSKALQPGRSAHACPGSCSPKVAALSPCRRDSLGSRPLGHRVSSRTSRLSQVTMTGEPGGWTVLPHDPCHLGKRPASRRPQLPRPDPPLQPPRPAGLSVLRTSATGLRPLSSQQTWVRGTGDRSNTEERRGGLALDRCPSESQLCMGRSPEDVHRLHPVGPPSLHQLQLHTHAHAVHTCDSPPPTEHAHGRPAHSLITHLCPPSQSWEGNHKPAPESESGAGDPVALRWHLRVFRRH